MVVALGSSLYTMAETAVRTRPITLDDAITLARVQSVNAAVALNELKTAYWVPSSLQSSTRVLLPLMKVDPPR